MSIVLNLFTAWSAILGLMAPIDQARVEREVRASLEVELGDDEARVRAIMGRPIRQLPRRAGVAGLLLGFAPPRWVYGRAIEPVVFPDAYPLTWRLFEPEEQDVVIVWGDDGKVASITRP